MQRINPVDDWSDADWEMKLLIIDQWFESLISANEYDDLIQLYRTLPEHDTGSTIIVTSTYGGSGADHLSDPRG